MVTGASNAYGKYELDIAKAVGLRDFRNFFVSRNRESSKGRSSRKESGGNDFVILVEARSENHQDLCSIVQKCVARNTDSYGAMGVYPEVQCLSAGPLALPEAIETLGRVHVLVSFGGPLSKLIVFSPNNTQVRINLVELLLILPTIFSAVSPL